MLTTCRLVVGMLVLVVTGPAAAEPRESLRVEGDRKAIPVQVSGGMHAFGLTPFQLRDIPSGDYMLRVQSGTWNGGASRLEVRSNPAGSTYEVGSVRWPLMLRSAVLPGLGHLQSGHSVRGGSAMGQTLLAAGKTWSEHLAYLDAESNLAAAEAAYRSELDSELLPERRDAWLDAQAEAAQASAARKRWLAVTAWAYGSSLFDLYFDSRPVADLVADSTDAARVMVRSSPVSRGLSVLRATVHPGSGHYALNRRWRGLAFEVLSSVGVAACLEMRADVHQAASEYRGVRRDYLAANEDELDAARASLQAAHANWQDQREQQFAAMWTTGAVWLLNIVDVCFADPVPATSDLELPKRLAAEVGPNGFALRARF